MKNLFEFRQLLAKDEGTQTVGATAPTSGKWPTMGGVKPRERKANKKPYILRKGSQDDNILGLLKTFKGEKTLEELAEMIGKSRGEGKMEPSSLRARISVITDFLRKNGISEGKINTLLPKNYGTGRRGRRSTLEPATHDSLVDFLSDVEETDRDEDEGEESDLSDMKD